MVKTQKYGKRIFYLITQKNSFFEQNDTHLQVEKAIAEVYTKQLLRIRCKNCDAPLPEGYDFIEVETPYVFCERCGHCNGRYEDSSAFCDFVYNSDEGESYGINYSVADKTAYSQRMETIYLPKAEFLLSVLQDEDRDIKSLKFLDFGAGSGYFVAALQKLGADIEGYEISSSQVEFANEMLKEELLYSFEPQETEKMIANSKSSIFSMIGVLEHLQDPRTALRAIRENKNIEYLYISVPLFSFSVFFEKLSPDIFSRQLSGGHNHLYTEESLHYMFEEFGFEVLGEWWFGSDMMDIYRHVDVMMQQTHSSDKMRTKWQNSFGAMIDKIQLVLDKEHLSSEVHIVLKKS